MTRTRPRSGCKTSWVTPGAPAHQAVLTGLQAHHGPRGQGECRGDRRQHARGGAAEEHAHLRLRR